MNDARTSASAIPPFGSTVRVVRTMWDGVAPPRGGPLSLLRLILVILLSVPILLLMLILVLAALAVGAAMFLVGWVWMRVSALAGRMAGRRDGRENVRVLVRDE